MSATAERIPVRYGRLNEQQLLRDHTEVLVPRHGSEDTQAKVLRLVQSTRIDHRDSLAIESCSMKFILPLACVVGLGLQMPAQQPSRPEITGIAFARFYTTDSAAAQHFYGDMLGYTRTGHGATWIYPVNRSQWIELQTTTPPPQANVRMGAVGFTTRDAKALEKYLVTRGIHPEQPLHNGQFAIRDPEGNLVIFVQRGSQKEVAGSQRSPSAASTRMIHVGFVVHDREKEDEFWQQVLGFRPYWHGGHTDDVTDWVSLQVPDGTDWLEYMLNPGADMTLRRVGVMDHFSLGVAQMQNAVAALARNHCEGANCTKTQMGRDGKVQLNLFDPDQTRVEFMEFAPSQEPCCSPFTGAQPTPEESQ